VRILGGPWCGAGVIRDRFVAAFAVGPIAAGCLGRLGRARTRAITLAIPLAIPLAIALASLLTAPCAQAKSATETRIAPPVSRKARPALARPGSPA